MLWFSGGDLRGPESPSTGSNWSARSVSGLEPEEVCEFGEFEFIDPTNQRVDGGKIPLSIQGGYLTGVRRRAPGEERRFRGIVARTK